MGSLEVAKPRYHAGKGVAVGGVTGDSDPAPPLLVALLLAPPAHDAEGCVGLFAARVAFVAGTRRR